MKSLMVMGAAVEQLPGIKKAKEMGFRVGVIDYNPNAIGVPLADEYYNVSTIDEEGVYQAAKEFGADGFLTLATDLPMRAVAKACERLHLPGISYETALKSTDKGAMIKAFKACKVESPWYFIVNNEDELERLADEVTLPAIMKPVDNAASRGVVLVNSKDEMLREFHYSHEYSHNGSVIIEEYMVGKEVSVEVLSVKGIPHVLQITDKMTTGAPHFVELGHNQPSLLSEQEQFRIKNLAERAVKAVGIECGPAHVEIMMTDDGPKVIELGARLGGDCITSHLVELSTGIDMLKETITVLSGGDPNLKAHESKGAAIRFLSDTHKGILQKVDGLEEAKKMAGIREVSMIMNPGDTIQEEIYSSDDRIAYVIAQAKSANEAVAIAEKALKILKVVRK